jgi:hypothetical protein
MLEYMCNISACERNVMNITEVESVLHSPNLHGLHLQQIDQISLSQRPRSLSHSAHGHEWRSIWSSQSFKPSRSGYRLHPCRPAVIVCSGSFLATQGILRPHYWIEQQKSSVISIYVVTNENFLVYRARWAWAISPTRKEEV